MCDEPDGQIIARRLRIACILLAVVATILAGWALRALSILAIPLAFAFFLAIVVRPIQTAVERRMPPVLRWLGLVAAMLVILLLLGAFLGGVSLAFSGIADESQKYIARATSLWEEFRNWAAGHGWLLDENMLQVERIRETMVDWAASTVALLESLLAGVTLVFFFVLLMLLEAHHWRGKTTATFPEDREDGVHEAVNSVAIKTRRWILIRTALSAASAVAAGLWLWATGVDFALAWAILIFLLNYIPNIGSIVGVVPPTIMALIQPDGGLVWAIVVIAGLTLIEQVIGNFLSPRVEGRALAISPVVLLASLLVWSYIWGVAGAFLAAPMTIMLLVIFAHTPKLRPLALLISRTEDVEQLRREASADQ